CKSRYPTERITALFLCWHNAMQDEIRIKFSQLPSGQLASRLKPLIAPIGHAEDCESDHLRIQPPAEFAALDASYQDRFDLFAEFSPFRTDRFSVLLFQMPEFAEIDIGDRPLFFHVADQ